MTIVAFLALVFTIWQVDPQHASFSQIVLFYIALFVLFAGSGALFFRMLCRRILHATLSVGKALGLGGLCAGFATIATFLQDTRSLRYPTLGGVVVAGVLIIYLLRKKGYHFFS
ncbi:MAG: hypothetical protein A3A30_01620 [Candidatus Terrybacteria bacterium RIFCSPLOWO2_01_FULL_48_14]|nr:MAG: hypothetical protein A3A30_01620 [Candidatus Terrybacteria bacterium RIFCSPLOWO2_01_FULL_48_14]